jgi:hypothetical protein
MDWKRYPTVGFKFEFPSNLKDFHIGAGIEGGRLHSQNQLHTINCLHLSLGLMYESQLLHSKIWIYPQVGLVSMMISEKKLSNTLKNSDTFSDVENEYGISIGCEPRLKFRNFFVGLPISIERIFSSPKTFDSFVIAIRTGYTFKK